MRTSIQNPVMTCRAFTFLAFRALTLVFLFSISAHADNERAALRDKLEDIQTLIEAGIDYTEYSSRVSELLLLQRRYQKIGGKEQGLLFAVEAHVNARNAWNQKIAYSGQTSASQAKTYDKLIQIYWKGARDQMQVVLDRESGKIK